jgi:hypothetical protein
MIVGSIDLGSILDNKLNKNLQSLILLSLKELILFSSETRPLAQARI